MREATVNQDETAEYQQQIHRLLSNSSLACPFLTQTSVQTDEQLTDAEGDGGVSRDHDGFVSPPRVSAVIDLKLQQNHTQGCSTAESVQGWGEMLLTLMAAPLIPAWTLREHCRVVLMLSTTTHSTLRPLSLDWRTRQWSRSTFLKHHGRNWPAVPPKIKEVTDLFSTLTDLWMI